MSAVPDDDSKVYLITPTVDSARTWATNHHVDISRVVVIARVQHLRGLDRGLRYRLWWPMSVPVGERDKIIEELAVVAGTLVKC